VNLEADKEQLVQLFLELRRRGRLLGVAELTDALRALDAPREAGAAWPGAKRIAELLFCDTTLDQRDFEDAWRIATGQLQERTSVREPELRREAERQEHEREQVLERMSEALTVQLPAVPAAAELEVLPVRAPAQSPPDDGPPGLQHDWPLTRRMLVYAWRFLRRPVADGPADVLDVEATVERAARMGFFLAPVYRRHITNQARLLLLVDRRGSMTPFHRFAQDIVETAREQSGIKQVDIYYFNNAPLDVLYLDTYLTDPLPLEQVLDECDADTSVMVVSDAGAARGLKSLERIRQTALFLARLRRRTVHIVWLNPMPEQRWRETSAQAIARFAPMFALDPDGFSRAIDVVRGV
jgi:uncharacterized protein with von Willebrand factor type A (vWA) domain